MVSRLTLGAPRGGTFLEQMSFGIFILGGAKAVYPEIYSHVRPFRRTVTNRESPAQNGRVGRSAYAYRWDRHCPICVCVPHLSFLTAEMHDEQRKKENRTTLLKRLSYVSSGCPFLHCNLATPLLDLARHSACRKNKVFSSHPAALRGTHL